jgi:hypothetical protein
MTPEATSEPVLTPRLRLGFGMLAFGIGLMFFSGKVLPLPVPTGIAGGIALAIAGFVVVIVEALREPPEESAQSRYAVVRRPAGRPPPPARFWKHSRQYTGLPAVGRNGTCVSFPHSAHTAGNSARPPVSEPADPPPLPPFRVARQFRQRVGSCWKPFSA